MGNVIIFIIFNKWWGFGDILIIRMVKVCIEVVKISFVYNCLDFYYVFEVEL